MTNKAAARVIHERVFDRGESVLLEQIMTEGHVQDAGSATLASPGERVLLGGLPLSMRVTAFQRGCPTTNTLRSGD